MSRTLRESIALGAIGAAYERLLDYGESLQAWYDNETGDEWNGPEVETASHEAYQEVRRAMEEWAKEVPRG
jgi:hypothetical protein